MLTYPVSGPGGRSLSRFWDDHRDAGLRRRERPRIPELLHRCSGRTASYGSSYFTLIEAQTHHIVRCLKQGRRRHASRVEVSQEANDRYFAEMMRKRHRQIFWQDSCQLANSYYFDKNGDVPLRAGQHGRGVLAQPPLPARRLPLHRVARVDKESHYPRRNSAIPRLLSGELVRSSP